MCVVPKYQEVIVSSINQFFLLIFFSILFSRITALENIFVVASISQDYPMTDKRKREKKSKAKPCWLAYNLISAFVVSEKVHSNTYYVQYKHN